MLNQSLDHTSESPEDKQRKLRRFVTDLVHDSIGNMELDTWMLTAVQEKIEHDIGRIYPATHLEGSTQARKVVAGVQGSYRGVLYLNQQKILVIVTMDKKHVINVLRTDPSLAKDVTRATQLRSACLTAGLQVDTVAFVHIPYDSNAKSDIWTSVYGAKDPEPVRQFVTGLVTAVITQNSDRDVQRMPGPSDLANPCDFCVARKIANACGIDFPPNRRNFSLKAWTGTAAHQKLERDLPQHNGTAQQEITVAIAEIEGLGVIKGHVDLYLPGIMGDFKTVDLGGPKDSKMKKSLYNIKRYGVPVSHRGQTMMYMYGLRRSGQICDHATLVYIPRDSSQKSDIWTASCAYRGDIAVGLLNRTQDLFTRLRAGEVDSLQSDPDCFVCHVQQYTRS